MSISCYDLLSLKYFKEIKLVSGKSGLYRQVTWPYICTSNSISQWIHGGELVFIDGAGFASIDDNLIRLVDECMSKPLAGIVLVSGDEHFKHISDRLFQYSEEKRLPIFVMNRNTKIIDVTQEISELILNRREQYKQSQLFLDRLLFSDEDKTGFNELYDLFNISNKPYRFISIFNIAPIENSNKSYEYIKNDLKNYLYHQNDNSTKSLITLEASSNIVCLASANSIQTVDTLLESIKNVLYKISQRYQNSVIIYLGIGRIYSDEEQCNIKLSFLEAQRAISLIKKGFFDDNILFYDDVGIYKILYEIKDVNEIKSFYESKIGGLFERDIKSGGNLVDTLRCYLKNNCNLVNTAQDLFIHRNTLIYRLNTIREILQKDLNDSSVRFELYMSLLTYDFIEK